MDVWSGGQGYRPFVRVPQDGNPALSDGIPVALKIVTRQLGEAQLNFWKHFAPVTKV